MPFSAPLVGRVPLFHMDDRKKRVPTSSNESPLDLGGPGKARQSFGATGSELDVREHRAFGPTVGAKPPAKFKPMLKPFHLRKNVSFFSRPVGFTGNVCILFRALKQMEVCMMFDFWHGPKLFESPRGPFRRFHFDVRNCLGKKYARGNFERGFMESVSATISVRRFWRMPLWPKFRGPGHGVSSKPQGHHPICPFGDFGASSPPNELTNMEVLGKEPSCPHCHGTNSPDGVFAEAFS